MLGRWQRVYFLTFNNTTTRSETTNAGTDFLIMPGISLARVPAGLSR